MLIFVFSKEDNLIGDFRSENLDDIASELNKWALAEKIKIPKFAYAVGGEGRRWTVIENEPLKLVAGIKSELETQSDVLVNSSQQNEILLKILETQEKQLSWIRLLAVPVLISVISFLLRILFSIGGRGF
jgi:hypothetical protein